MKRLVALFLALLMMLCGCGSNVSDPTQQESSVTTTPSTEAIPPARPDFGLYEPDSTVETQTGGAVKYYPLDGVDHYAVEQMGEGLLLFAGDDTTTLTLLREESDPIKVALNCYLYPDGCTLRINEDGLYYFDNLTSEIVTMRSDLQEISRIPMPEDFVASPVLSSDGKRAYYFSSSALRCFELDTGISRLLRDSSFVVQEVWDIHFNDTVLECFALDGDQNLCMFVSTQTGELLESYNTYPELETAGDRYFAEHFDGHLSQYLTGERGDKLLSLQPGHSEIMIKPMLGVGGVLGIDYDDTGVALNYYDLDSGLCSAQIRLEGLDLPVWTMADQSTGLIWVLAHDLNRTTQAMYCWDITLSPGENETTYLTPYYTASEPDKAGLAEIAKQAKALGEKYGVRIRVWEEAGKIQPDDYTFELEYLVPVYEEYLPALEKTLSAFPEGFLKKLGKSSANGVLTISLVRGLYGNNALGSLTTATGIHFWHDGSGYIAIPIMGEVEMDQSLFHEIFHAIDSYVMAECVAYDNWPDLNPAGFFYDYSYVTNQFREDYQYLEVETRAFIDMYSMSYPKEDRARIFEFAMMEGNESFFQSDIMQVKLKTLCKGIREAFKLKKYTEPLPWEQYLK